MHGNCTKTINRKCNIRGDRCITKNNIRLGDFILKYKFKHKGLKFWHDIKRLGT
jgi:hypothetical protein